MMENSKTGLTDKLVESILVDGTPIENFQQNVYEYEVPVVSIDSVPKVTVSVNDADAMVTVEQADSLPGTAVVKVVPSGADEADAWVYTCLLHTSRCV